MFLCCMNESSGILPDGENMKYRSSLHSAGILACLMLGASPAQAQDKRPEIMIDLPVNNIDIPEVGIRAAKHSARGKTGRLLINLNGPTLDKSPSARPGNLEFLSILPIRFGERAGDDRLWVQAASFASSKDDQWPIEVESIQKIRDDLLKANKDQGDYQICFSFTLGRDGLGDAICALKLPVMGRAGAVQFLDHWLKEDLLVSCDIKDDPYNDPSVVKFTWLGTSLRDAVAKKKPETKG